MAQFGKDEIPRASLPLPRKAWPHDGEKVVYFVGSADGPIKIGRSSIFRKRMSALQISSGDKLHLWAWVPGGTLEEAMWHGWLREHRLNGEWFKRCPEVVAKVPAYPRELAASLQGEAA